MQTDNLSKIHNLMKRMNMPTLNEMQERDYFGEILLKRGKEDIFI